MQERSLMVTNGYIAEQIFPSLIPHILNPNLSLEAVCLVMNYCENFRKAIII